MGEFPERPECDFSEKPVDVLFRENQGYQYELFENEDAVEKEGFFRRLKKLLER